MRTLPVARRGLDAWIVVVAVIGSAVGAFSACGSDDSSQSWHPTPNPGGSGGHAGGAGAGATGGAGSGGAGGTTNPGGSGGSGGMILIDGGGGAAGNGGTCAGISATAKALEANVLVLLDMSGTMSDDVNGKSKYQATLEAMNPVLAGLEPSLRMGLVFFGRPDGCVLPDGCCAHNSINGGPDVPIAPLDAAQKGALGAWATTHSPSDANSTPTGPALAGAYDILVKSGLDGTYYVLLITDGAENCLVGLPSMAVTYAQQAASGSPPVKTFVIGSPGSENYLATLSDIAKQGGTPRTPNCNGQPGNTCHYDLTANTADFEAQMQQALSDILGGVSIPCTYSIPSQDGGLFDPSQVNVNYTSGSGPPQTILQDTTQACADAAGWQYNSDKTQILLCGTVCQTVQSDPNARIDIVFGCPTVVLK